MHSTHVKSVKNSRLVRSDHSFDPYVYTNEQLRASDDDERVKPFVVDKIDPPLTPPPWLFLGIWNWGGIDKCLGGGIHMRQTQNYIKQHKKTEKITELGGVSLDWGVFTPSGGV